MTPAAGGRLSREQRRTQLVGIGLTLLERIPFQSLSIDDVAARAGISRSLLFHYFPTKQDYLAAVVRSASEHVLSLTDVPDSVSSDDRTRAIVTALVRYIQRRRDNYVAVIRSARAVDTTLQSFIDEMYDTLCVRMLASIGVTDPDPVTLVATRAWLSSIEELALLGEGARIPQIKVIDFGVTSFRQFTVSELMREFVRSET